MRRIPIPTVLTAAALVVVLVVWAVTFQVGFADAAVKVRFGRVDDRSVIDGRDPNNWGLHLKWPPPFEVVQKYDTRMRVLDTPETELKTQDGHNVIVGCYAIWRIADPLLYFKRVRNDARAMELLRARVNESRSIVLGRHSLGELVNLDAGAVDRSHAQIQSELRDHAAPGIRSDYGVELVQVGMRRVSLPTEATQKVQEAMVQERERLATTFREEGKAIASSIKAGAEEARKQILQFAERRAKEIESEGVQASTRILAQIAPEDSEFFLWLRSLDALEVMLKSKSTIFLDWNTDVFRWFERPFGTPLAAPAQGSGGAAPLGSEDAR
jgi:membrane protease subunit HflC